MTKYWTVFVSASLATLLTAFFPLPFARADIFEWEYVNPANPGEGKQQSTTLAPDGAGAYAGPGTDLSGRNLTMAYLIGANLSAIPIYGGESGYEIIGYVTANLTDANLTQADLTNANFEWATLTGANLTGAEVRGANFIPYEHASGITLSQLYSTASYQAHDLTGIVLGGNNLAGANLAGQNLTNGSFGSIPGGIFTNAEVRGATFWSITATQLYSTASYQAHDLTGIVLVGSSLAGANLAGQNLTNAVLGIATLTNVNFSQANLTNANLGSATLTDTDFTGAEVRGANISDITAAQLYSTASYQVRDLTGIRLDGSDLTGVNFAGQNLTNANFTYATLTQADFRGANVSHVGFYSANLTGANFAGQNLTNAYFYSATLTNANLSGADARGANFYEATLTGANTSNLIQSGGHIAGLNLTAGASLVVRDYDGNPAVPAGPLPIVVDQHLAMDATGTLRLVFDADAWDSTISFAAGIPVTRAGTLELTFAPGVNIATQSGRTIDLFDWTGVTPTGAFTVSSPYTWNLTNLYTTGEVTLTAVPSLPGDFNLDGTVDAADYVVWRKTGGTQAGYNTWRANFGQPSGSGSVAGANATVPEPATLVMLIVATVGIRLRRRHIACECRKLNSA